MSEELEKLLAEGDKTSPQALAKAKAEADAKAEETKKVEEKKKAEEHLANIKKAILEGNAELKKIREAKKKPADALADEDEETPKIDFNDPGSKAWEKHISGKMNPITEELAKEKEEIRAFALNEFLEDKPELAKDPEKLKKVMSTYEKIRTSTERTREGVLTDLTKAYAAENAYEILANRDNQRISRAQGEAIFSDAGISRGSSSFRNEREAVPQVSREDELILAKWGMSTDEWIKLKKAQEKK